MSKSIAAILISLNQTFTLDLQQINKRPGMKAVENKQKHLQLQHISSMQFAAAAVEV